MKTALLSICLITSASFAGVTAFLFEATIEGSQEVPPTPSPATGWMTGVYDSVANTFSFEWEITDELIGAPASPGAHIHFGAAGVNGGVVFGFNNPDGTWPLAGSAVWSGLSALNVDRLFDGNLYINFHTTEYPGGEVRGQITLVPAPAAAGLLGLCGLIAARRRR